MTQIHLTILTPTDEIFNDSVDMVTAPTSEGELGILPEHTNLMAQLVPGALRIKKNNQTIHLATGGGLLQVTRDGVSIVTDLAKKAEEIDEKEVEEARRRAEQALAQTLSDEEYATTMAVLERSLAQLKVKRHHRIK